jgi:hypothetical protein
VSLLLGKEKEKVPYCLHKVGCKNCPEPQCTQKSGWEKGELESSKTIFDLKNTMKELNEKIRRRRS